MLNMSVLCPRIPAIPPTLEYGVNSIFDSWSYLGVPIGCKNTYQTRWDIPFWTIEQLEF